MKASKILRPKTDSQIIQDFAESHKIDWYELRDFITDFKKNKISRWILGVLYILVIIFALSMILNGIIAMSGKYFWFPISQTKSMLTFINIFWGISWYAFAVIIGVIAIIKLVNINE